MQRADANVRFPLPIADIRCRTRLCPWRVFPTHLSTGFQKARAASRISAAPSSPKKDIAYKRLDVQVAKTFKMPCGPELTADIEALNVFNWLNRTHPTWGAGADEPPPLTENGQVANDQRRFQVGLTCKF